MSEAPRRRRWYRCAGGWLVRVLGKHVVSALADAAVAEAERRATGGRS
jgi:hypothetical protein